MLFPSSNFSFRYWKFINRTIKFSSFVHFSKKTSIEILLFNLFNIWRQQIAPLLIFSIKSSWEKSSTSEAHRGSTSLILWLKLIFSSSIATLSRGITARTSTKSTLFTPFFARIGFRDSNTINKYSLVYWKGDTNFNNSLIWLPSTSSTPTIRSKLIFMYPFTYIIFKSFLYIRPKYSIFKILCLYYFSYILISYLHKLIHQS